MPVLSDRSDVIVITDEAHRSQYDTLALNMRQALPNAAFMGFTGTPLIDGEELTREQFGDYVSVYNFRDAIEDGATVPLYYENRIPELQIVNENFADELGELLRARTEQFFGMVCHLQQIGWHNVTNGDQIKVEFACRFKLLHPDNMAPTHDTASDESHCERHS